MKAGSDERVWLAKDISGLLSFPIDRAQHGYSAFVIVLGVVGPNLLYAKIARVLSRAGWPVLGLELRYDGHGERGIQNLSTGGVCKLQRALSSIEERFGHCNFVVVGLCAGANLAFNALRKDDRIVGAILLGPYPQMRVATMTKITARIFSSRAWWRFLVNSTIAEKLALARSLVLWSTGLKVLGSPPSEQVLGDIYLGASFADHLDEVAKRGKRVLMLVDADGGDVSHRFLETELGAGWYKLQGVHGIAIELLSDMVQIRDAALQRDLIDRVRRWLDANRSIVLTSGEMISASRRALAE